MNTHDSDASLSRKTVEEIVSARLGEVEDPELPVGIVDLGMARGMTVTQVGGGRWAVEVQLVPTFLGCPAQIFIERDVRQALEKVPAIAEVEIRWVSAEKWSLGDITAHGREALRQVGVAVPDENGQARCPQCGSYAVVIDSEFGASLCRRLAHCDTCGENVELMRVRAERARSAGLVPAPAALAADLLTRRPGSIERHPPTDS